MTPPRWVLGLLCLLPVRAGAQDFACTELLAFSQTIMWHETAQFKSHIPDANWQVRYQSGGHLNVWADPNAAAWTAPTQVSCGGLGPVVCTPCAAFSTAPDRVVVTISRSRYEANVDAWISSLRAVIATIRQRHPQVRQIVLQPIVGGPNHQLCPIPQDPFRGVRAAFNHPPIDEAVAVVLGDAPDLVAGPSPEVAACAEYSDQSGHFIESARGPIGDRIGQWYEDFDAATTTTTASTTITTTSVAPTSSTSTLPPPSTTSTSPPPTTSTTSSTSSSTATSTSTSTTLGSAPVERSFRSIAAEDGNVVESSETSNAGDTANATSQDLQVGDHLGDRQFKIVLSFDTAALPDVAPIVSATLRLRRVGLWGTSPFLTFGACAVDVQPEGFGGDPALQPNDFEAVAAAPTASALSAPAANGDWSTATLDAAGLAAISRTGRTQVRVAFTLDDDDDGLVDRIRYAAGDHADAASRPELIVTVLE